MHKQYSKNFTSHMLLTPHSNPMKEVLLLLPFCPDRVIESLSTCLNYLGSWKHNSCLFPSSMLLTTILLCYINLTRIRWSSLLKSYSCHISMLLLWSIKQVLSWLLPPLPLLLVVSLFSFLPYNFCYSRPMPTATSLCVFPYFTEILCVCCIQTFVEL